MPAPAVTAWGADTFPKDLTDRRQWLVWRFVQKEGSKKPSKIPYYASGKLRRGVQGSDDDRAELVSYADALAAVDSLGMDGLGFAFLPGDGLIGIDLDGCTGNPERETRAQRIISACASYTERSPSGNGYHIIVAGQTETFKSNEIGVEVFCGSQFFTMTGQWVGDAAPVAQISDKTLETLRNTVRKATPPPPPAPVRQDIPHSAKVESALAMISPDCGYEDWIRVGMAIHATLGEGASGVWDRWSSRGAKYKGGKDIDSHWKSFRAGGVGEGTLFKMAMDAGWRPPAQQRQPTVTRQSGNVAPSMAPAITPENVDPETGEILDLPAPANDNAPESAAPASAWGRPIDLFGVQLPPALGYDCLPGALVPYVQDQAGLTGCDPGIIGLAALVSAAACIDDGIRLQPKRHDPTWTESARLWFAVVGDPSTKKSPAISKAVRHVKRINHRMAEDNAASFGDWKWQHEQWKEAKKADKTNPPPEPEKPAQKRLLVEDITVEALTDVLKDNPRGVLTLKDELTGWFASMDAYRGGAKGASMDRAHWLEAYNGGRRSIDRVTRGSIVVPNWSTCIIGGVQPDMIRRVASSMGNDGLLQRFMVLVARPASLDEDRAPNMRSMEEFGQLFDKLAALRPDPQHVVVLTEAAHQVRERVARQAKRLIDAMDHPHLQAWLGKWDGLFARLLLLYHVIDCATASVYPTNEQVSGETADQVERLLTGVLLHHAIHFYTEILDANERQDHIRQLGRLILAKGWDRVTKRDIAQSWKASRKLEAWELRTVIDALCVADWLQPDEADLGADGKPRSWWVNPEVHAMFSGAAERERARRTEAVEVLRSIKEAHSMGT